MKLSDKQREDIDKACREASQAVSKMTRAEKDELFKKGMEIIDGKLGKRIEIFVDGKFLLGANYTGEINNHEDTLKMLKEMIGLWNPRMCRTRKYFNFMIDEELNNLDKQVRNLNSPAAHYIVCLISIIKRQQKQIESLHGLICHAHAAQQIKEQENLAKNL